MRQSHEWPIDKQLPNIQMEPTRAECLVPSCQHGARLVWRGARETMKTLRVQSVDQWRDWLDEHHASESGVWLIFYKLHTGVGSIAYQDALDEALCFGWVDSLVKRLDDRRYALKFTPRRADSRWSDANRKRYAERTIETGGNQTASDRSRLRSSTTTASNALKTAGVHTGSVEGSFGGATLLRSADTFTSPTVYRLD